MAGIFLVLEGPSGSGKSTLQKSLGKYFTNLGHEVILTKEPTTKFNSNDENTKKGIELSELYLADRKEHVLECIMPNLMAQKTVICDRYIPSTMVYQQIEGIPNSTIIAQNIEFPVPTLTVFLNVDIELLTKRVNERSVKTRFEADTFRAQEVKVYNQIPNILSSLGWNTMTIDADRLTVDNITELIATVILPT